MKKLRLNDRVEVSDGKIKIQMSPITYWQKNELAESIRIVGGEQEPNMTKYLYLCVKYSVKKVEGITFFDGEEFEVKFDDDGHLDDESIEVVLGLEPIELKSLFITFGVQGPERLIGSKDLGKFKVKYLSKKSSK